MKTTKFLAITLIATFALTGCQKDLVNTQIQPQQPQKEVAHYFEPSKETLASFDKLLHDPASVANRTGCQWIEIPAGSTNALAQAVSDACTGGVIYLKSGIHTETQRVTISKQVIILGEAGAVLKVQSVLAPADAAGKYTLSPALHVLNAQNVAFLNLDIQPITGDGATAILFENAAQGAVVQSKLTNFEFGIFLEKSDRIAIMNNTIKASAAWKTAPNPQTSGILLSSSQSAYIAGNDLSNALWGAFLSDKWGTATNNTVHDNRIGIQFCGLRPDYFLPNGQLSGADASATAWKINGNVASNNVYVGYFFISSAHWNIFTNNTGTGNGSYDVELNGDTNRSGFFAAATYSNTINVSSSQKIKDCGNNNVVTGGIMSADACTAPITNNMVMTWNLASTQAIANMGSGPDALPPMPEARIYAMVQIAVHDALNNIYPRYRSYALNTAGDVLAHPDAAVAQAAHDVIVNQLPPQQTFADNLLTTSLNAIPNGDAKTRGIALGKAAAAAIINLRANDGVANAQTGYVQGTLPGQYRSTPPFDGPPFNGFVAVPAWGQIKPFGMTSGSQFRVSAPYPINSADYTADFNEIKTLGRATGSTRTADQTQIAIFWLENVPLSFNRIARTMVAQKKLNAWETARLFALLQIAEADANIGCLESKFFYNYWRPITAVRLGDNDGNPNTVGDATWDVLAPPTPPVPDYPSNHATNGGAGAAVLAAFFGNDNASYTQTSSSLPNTTRTLTSFSQAARENALSRIYVGYHFRNACLKGEEQGKQIGKYIFDHYLGER